MRIVAAESSKRLASIVTVGAGLLLGACRTPVDPTVLPEDPEQSLAQLTWLAGDWRQLDTTAPRGQRWWLDGTELRGETWVQDGPRRLLLERLRVEVADDRLWFAVESLANPGSTGRLPLLEQARRAVAFEDRDSEPLWRVAYVEDPTGMELLTFHTDPDVGGSRKPRVDRRRFVRAR
ncbi:MAG: hypothetical protein ACYSWX_00245 [Planctomycetota bacterium]|jgi:hypothetical protein